MRRRWLIVGLLLAMALAFVPSRAASPYYSIKADIVPTDVPGGFIITGFLCLVPNCTPSETTPTFTMTGKGKTCSGIASAMMLIDWKNKTSSKGYLDIIRPNSRMLFGFGIVLAGARVGNRVAAAMMANGDPCLVEQSVTGSMGF